MTISRFITVILFSIISLSSNSQIQGCTDETACNFNPNASIDDGRCHNQLVWLIPEVIGSLPAIQGCEAPEGYVYTNNFCVNSVIQSGSYCEDNIWDEICQEAYEACIEDRTGCKDETACNYEDYFIFHDESQCIYEPIWFIPDMSISSGEALPAVQSCGQPEGYLTANQNCASQIISSDSYCIDFNWDLICQSAYDTCIEGITGCTNELACNYNSEATIDDGSCTNDLVWYIPWVPTAFNGSSPAILSCGPVSGYKLADQCCVSAIIAQDDYCINITWDQTCQEAYDNCLETGIIPGCSDPEACNYVECVNLSNGSCTYEQWYIPDVLSSSPVVLSCEPIEGFTLANQCALELLIGNDPYCINTNYDATCENSYEFLLSNLGCTDSEACNFDPLAICDETVCDYSCFGCGNLEACNFIFFATHNEEYCDYFSCGNDDDFFITKWQTTVENEVVTIPLNNLYISNNWLTVDYFVDWGDGTFSNHVTGTTSHVYDTPNAYNISIMGEIPAIKFGDELNPNMKLLEVVQWGNNSWQTMEDAFNNCQNLQVTASDNPNLSEVNSTESMFYNCISLTGGLNNWDVSNIENMSSMFEEAVLFNHNIGSWDVSNVTDMERMFYHAETFNQDLDLWNISNVNSIRSMFYQAHSFNGDVSTWDVSNMTSLRFMFTSAYNFNQDVSSWDVSNVTDMYYIFGYATNFNQDIGSWDVSNVTNMSHMLMHTKNFNQDISSWDVSNVMYMNHFLAGSSNFNQDIGSWDVSNVVDMGNMLSGLKYFNYDLNNWDVSSVTSMFGMLQRNPSFNGDISNWDVSNVTNMQIMFSESTAFNQDIGSWDVSGVTNMINMFVRAESFNQDINSWDVSNVTNMTGMFGETEQFNQDLSSWDVSNVTEMERMFKGAKNFNQDLSAWNVSNVAKMRYMFFDAESFDQDISSWDFSGATNVHGLISNSVLSVANYDLLLAGLAEQIETLQPNLTLGAEGLNYCESQEERNLLMSAELGWAIEDSGLLCAAECVGDLNSDGTISAQDLSIFLAAYGTMGDDPADFNNDGVVGSQDLSLFLSVFGQDCF